jgi:hypothetical protein
MSLPEEPTLLQTALFHSRYTEDAGRAWAFLVFSGLLDSASYAAFSDAVARALDDVAGLADALLDHATRRAELLDVDEGCARRLWQYFEVGQTLEPDAEDEGTQPGVVVEP